LEGWGSEWEVEGMDMGEGKEETRASGWGEGCKEMRWGVEKVLVT